jgi:hypothetical protein
VKLSNSCLGLFIELVDLVHLKIPKNDFVAIKLKIAFKNIIK